MARAPVLFQRPRPVVSWGVVPACFSALQAFPAVLFWTRNALGARRVSFGQMPCKERAGALKLLRRGKPPNPLHFYQYSTGSYC